MKVRKGGHPQFYSILEAMGELHSRKNSDYSKGGIQGPLGNFERVASIKQLYSGFDWTSTYGTCIDFMLKQFDAMMILKASGNTSQTGEPVSARLRDIAIYTVIAEILESEIVANGLYLPPSKKIKKKKVSTVRGDWIGSKKARGRSRRKLIG